MSTNSSVCRVSVPLDSDSMQHYLLQMAGAYNVLQFCSAVFKSEVNDTREQRFREGREGGRMTEMSRCYQQQRTGIVKLLGLSLFPIWFVYWWWLLERRNHQTSRNNSGLVLHSVQVYESSNKKTIIDCRRGRSDADVDANGCSSTFRY